MLIVAVTRPICATEPVACSTSRGIAIEAKASPNTERVCPNQKILKKALCHNLAPGVVADLAETADVFLVAFIKKETLPIQDTIHR
jgi:hypothetical protein